MFSRKKEKEKKTNKLPRPNKRIEEIADLPDANQPLGKIHHLPLISPYLLNQSEFHVL